MRSYSLTKFASIALVALLLVGCGKTVVPGISDIDKSQPSVTLSAQYEGFDKVDWDSATKKATKQCQEFGYDRADPLELSVTACALYGYGCHLYQTTQKYICRNSN